MDKPIPIARCDGINRRDFLHLGAVSFLGLSLADVLRAQASRSTTRATGKAVSCILIWLDGGPSHVDTFDPKPDAPGEVRGDFKPIATSVPGVRICEHLPRTARMMSQVALIRSLTHELGNHDTGSRYLLTGHKPSPATDYPSLGSVVAKESEKSRSVLPPYVAVPGVLPAGGAGYLPGSCAPFSVGGDPSRPDYRVRDLDPPDGVSFDRASRRREMLAKIDALSRHVETSPATAGRDAYYEQAYRLMTSPAAKNAFDLAGEPDSVRNQYGTGRIGAGCLLARRLVEAGSRFVTVVDTGWDTHTAIFKALPDALFPGSGKLPALDHAYSALISDLNERGLLDTTLVVLMGEFGRTPKINGAGGRDHWPRAGFACLAGAGVRGGQVIGATDAYGEAPIDNPVRPEDLAFSMLQLLGVDPTRQYAAPNGRPLKILDSGEFIHGLI